MSPRDDPSRSDETYVTAIDPDDSPSEAVVTTVAALDGVPPTELAPLYDAVEPDALDALFDHAERQDRPGDQRLCFAYAGYDVTVCGDGTVSVSPTSTPATGAGSL